MGPNLTRETIIESFNQIIVKVQIYELHI